MTGDLRPRPCIIWLPHGLHCLGLTSGSLLSPGVLRLLPSAEGILLYVISSMWNTSPVQSNKGGLECLRRVGDVL